VAIVVEAIRELDADTATRLRDALDARARG
jgi:hypothetical protein